MAGQETSEMEKAYQKCAEAEARQKPIREWCDCAKWRTHDVGGEFINYHRMNFCIFCGKKLVKKRP
jgi:hypothetical protein